MSTLSLAARPATEPTVADAMALYRQLDIYDQREVIELMEKRIDDARDEIRAQRWS
jgi:hypothetical protein